MQVEKGRTLVYVAQGLVQDSAWPFEAGEEVDLTIDTGAKRLLVEKVSKRK